MVKEAAFPSAENSPVMVNCILCLLSQLASFSVVVFEIFGRELRLKFLMEELIVDSQETAVRINIMIVLRVNKPIIDEPSN
jgi:hypothetical protein